MAKCIFPLGIGLKLFGRLDRLWPFSRAPHPHLSCSVIKHEIR